MSNPHVSVDFQVVRKEVRYTLRIKRPAADRIDVNAVYRAVETAGDDALVDPPTFVGSVAANKAAEVQLIIAENERLKVENARLQAKASEIPGLSAALDEAKYNARAYGEVAHAIGVEYAADGVASCPGPLEDVLRAIRGLQQRERAALDLEAENARLRQLTAMLIDTVESRAKARRRQVDISRDAGGAWEAVELKASELEATAQWMRAIVKSPPDAPKEEG